MIPGSQQTYPHVLWTKKDLMILQIALDTPLRRVFDYRPPAEFAAAGTPPLEVGARAPRPGVRVRVPFGRQRLVGVVVASADTSEVPPGRLKPILEVLDPKPVLDAAAVIECREEARKVTVEEKVRRYIIELAVSTRQAAELVLGASPRAEVLLMLAAKAAAAFEGRDYVTPDDVKGLLRPTFRHRLLLRPEAEVGGQTADSLLDSVIARVTPPR